jgi:hypothetical protein
MVDESSALSSESQRDERWILADVLSQQGRGLVVAALLVGWVALALGLMLIARRDRMAIAIAPIAAVGLGLVGPLAARRRLLIGIVASFYVAVLSLEVAIRVQRFGLPGVTSFTAYRPYSFIDGLVVPVDDPKIVFELNPGLHTRFMGVDVDINSFGCRDRAWSQEPPVGSRRILVTGTSIAFGAGVNVDHTYSAVLGHELAATGETVEVLNCGRPGYTPAMSFRLAEELAKQLRPSVVVIELASGALMDDGDLSKVTRAFGRGAAPPPPVSMLERSSFFLTGLYPPSGFRARLDTLIHRPHSPTQPPSTRFIESEIEHLASWTHAAGIEPVVFIPRGMSSFEKQSPDFALKRRLADFAAARGVKLVDPEAAFVAGEMPDDFIVFPGDTHPNARAHARFAVELARALRKR